MSGSYPIDDETPDQNANDETERDKIRALAEALRMGNDGKIDDTLVEGVMNAIEKADNLPSTPARTLLGNSM